MPQDEGDLTDLHHIKKSSLPSIVQYQINKATIGTLLGTHSWGHSWRRSWDNWVRMSPADMKKVHVTFLVFGSMDTSIAPIYMFLGNDSLNVVKGTLVYGSVQLVLGKGWTLRVPIYLMRHRIYCTQEKGLVPPLFSSNVVN